MSLEPKEAGSSRGGKPKSHLRGHPQDSEDVRIGKTLSYILRHGAAKEGLKMRSDGYVKVDDLVTPKLNGVGFSKLEDLVKSNDKQRYQLLFEPKTPVEPGETERSSTEGTWWIRANQGHSLKVEELELREISSADEIPVVVHGTSRQTWPAIEKSGLSRMSRNHIHLATGKLGDEGVISGMRASHAKSGVLIYIDVPLAMADGIKFNISANGVVLTEGKNGILDKKYFKRVETADGQTLHESTHVHD
ncbi:phosphotransferase KptA/Tpt1 [Dacryopinax primogenitus]|uniref:2'-phosphotransferase n=1 Tax=Dacryopinax primogenitus (strain DJM 731) TaxID=1858805 RepID=M5G4R9_DACPD|nr:phosphotransferase KptA/Tpt1 [Dacryopinax primogenitus]EJU03669.1 phosphotransferase KptA/Tpt1 [Dacryopinax primogenitus]